MAKGFLEEKKSSRQKKKLANQKKNVFLVIKLNKWQKYHLYLDEEYDFAVGIKYKKIFHAFSVIKTEQTPLHKLFLKFFPLVFKFISYQPTFFSFHSRDFSS